MRFNIEKEIPMSLDCPGLINEFLFMTEFIVSLLEIAIRQSLMVNINVSHINFSFTAATTVIFNNKRPCLNR